MALAKQITVADNFNIDVTFDNAYIKIVNVKGNKEEVFISVNTYSENNGILVKEETYSFVPSLSDGSDNFIKQGYEHLKTLDKFANATDV